MGADVGQSLFIEVSKPNADAFDDELVREVLNSFDAYVADVDQALDRVFIDLSKTARKFAEDLYRTVEETARASRKAGIRVVAIDDPLIWRYTSRSKKVPITGADRNALVRTVESAKFCIRNASEQMQRTPATFSKVSENELRDIFLTSLNGLFEGGAKGEVFNLRGKTDFYLDVDKETTFIVEMKIYSGPKNAKEAFDQLNRYMTHMDNHGMVFFAFHGADFDNCRLAVFKAAEDFYQTKVVEMDNPLRTGTISLSGPGKREIELVVLHLPRG